MVDKTASKRSTLWQLGRRSCGRFRPAGAPENSRASFRRDDIESRFCPIQISRVTATKHRVLRLRSHIARSRDDLCFVNLQLEGVGRYTQRGHQQICGPGDLAVADTTEPFEIANCRDFQLFCFAVPRHLLPSNFSERPRLTLSATEVGRALSRTLSGYAELCLSSRPPSGIPAFTGAHIVDLIAHASAVLAEGPSERVNPPVLLSMMLDYIDRHSDDPDLGAATLAGKLNACSERYVHRPSSRCIVLRSDKYVNLDKRIFSLVPASS